ncbi:hypothetical protein M409DRAFT_19427 [Zasmidium cellare ATCC 36951]|uniref:Uncharacterized protein n=1 Tax=Zasmidium cellare ATCC 36951 TaxID=1080233 RepID=A0A6A6CWN2_ZASCE|nr:uncharacterized protein M409DRAFT_19427 [Zasmidium cellare ATCC 36951]KAF2170610.1 hypothetical protein M409DRAFT_19427 [Zasmidium cellare ATCC 36951]
MTLSMLHIPADLFIGDFRAAFRKKCEPGGRIPRIAYQAYKQHTSFTQKYITTTLDANTRINLQPATKTKMTLLLTRQLAHFPRSTPRLSSKRLYSTSPKPNPKTKREEDTPEIPSFSFKDLGASPTVKAVVYLGIGIIATAETYTYSMWAWNWWKRRGEGRVGEQ